MPENPDSGERQLTAGSLLAGLPKLTAAVAALSAALLPLLLPGRLIPEQLGFLRPTMSVFIVIAALSVWVFQQTLPRQARRILIVAVGCFLLVIAIQLKYVVTVANLGSEGDTYHFLTGFKVVDEGPAARVGVDPRNRVQLIRSIRASDIPVVYGWTYDVTAAAYVIGTIGTAIGIVLLMGAAEVSRRRRQAEREKEAAERIGILFLAANPVDTNRLRLGEEMRTIDERLQSSALRDSFEIDQHWAARISDLPQALLRHAPHVVHFSGHGSDKGELLFEDVAGSTDKASLDAIANLFGILKGNVRCVVLNACWSRAQAEAIARHIDCVIGTTKTIGDQSAISFAGGFYRGLGFGRSVQTAFELGCNEIDLNSLGQKDIPQLICRDGVDPADVYLAPSRDG